MPRAAGRLVPSVQKRNVFVRARRRWGVIRA